MPKLWVGSIAEHHRTVRDAILDTTATLAAAHGLASVTMSRIAQETGVGRATLYKYFSDVDAILVAWHERHVEQHLGRLAAVRDRFHDPWDRLANVLAAYAEIAYERSQEHGGGHARGHGLARAHGHADAPAHRAHHATDVSVLVHRTEHVADVQRRLSVFVEELVRAAARKGAVRKDVPAAELAQYCLQALGPASAARSRPAVRRLVDVTLAGLRPARR